MAVPAHAMEHELSAYYDITHGHGLAILTPRWLTYILNKTTAPAIYRLGMKVFGITEEMDAMAGAKKAINAVSDFCFGTLGLALTLIDLKIDKTNFKAMAEHTCMSDMITGLMKLQSADIEKIYEMCL